MLSASLEGDTVRLKERATCSRQFQPLLLGGVRSYSQQVRGAFYHTDLPDSDVRFNTNWIPRPDTVDTIMQPRTNTGTRFKLFKTGDDLDELPFVPLKVRETCILDSITELKLMQMV